MYINNGAAVVVEVLVLVDVVEVDVVDVVVVDKLQADIQVGYDGSSQSIDAPALVNAIGLYEYPSGVVGLYHLFTFAKKVEANLILNVPGNCVQSVQSYLLAE